MYPGVQLPSGVADLLQGADQLGPRRGYMALTMFRVAVIVEGVADASSLMIDTTRESTR